MTSKESAEVVQTEQEALAELANISPEDAQFLFNDPYSASVIRGNFKVGDKDVDPMEFITGRLSFLKEERVTEQQIGDAMAAHSSSTRFNEKEA